MEKTDQPTAAPAQKKRKPKGRVRGLNPSNPGNRKKSRKMAENGERALKTMQNAHQALQLRLSGATLQQIGEQLGFAPSSARHTAHRLLDRALDEIKGEISENTEKLRSIDCGRLERLLLALWPQATATPPDVEASRQAARIIQQLSKLRGTEVQPAMIQAPPSENAPPASINLIFVNAKVPEQDHRVVAEQTPSVEFVK